jgi:hypothetical protein
MSRTARNLALELSSALGFLSLFYVLAYMPELTRATSTLWLAVSADLLVIPVIFWLEPQRGGLVRRGVATVLGSGILALTIVAVVTVA